MLPQTIPNQTSAAREVQDGNDRQQARSNISATNLRTNSSRHPLAISSSGRMPMFRRERSNQIPQTLQRNPNMRSIFDRYAVPISTIPLHSNTTSSALPPTSGSLNFPSDASSTDRRLHLLSTAASLFLSNSPQIRSHRHQSNSIELGFSTATERGRQQFNGIYHNEWTYRSKMHFYELMYAMIAMCVFSLMVTFVCLFEISYIYVIGLLFVHDLIALLRAWNFSRQYLQSRNRKKFKILVVESFSLITTKIMLLVHFEKEKMIKAVFIMIPLGIYSLMRMWIQRLEKLSPDCNSVLNFSLLAQRLFLLLFAFTVSMKLDKSVQLDWQQSIWPYWIIFSVLCGFSFGSLLMTINKIYQVCTKNSQVYEFQGMAWIAFSLFGLTVGSCLLTFGLAKFLDTQSSHLLRILSIFTFFFLITFISISIYWKASIVSYIMDLSSFDPKFLRIGFTFSAAAADQRATIRQGNDLQQPNTHHSQESNSDLEIEDRSSERGAIPTHQEHANPNRNPITINVDGLQRKKDQLHNDNGDQEEEEEPEQPLSIPRFLEKLSNTFFKKKDSKNIEIVNNTTQLQHLPKIQQQSPMKGPRIDSPLKASMEKPNKHFRSASAKITINNQPKRQASSIQQLFHSIKQSIKLPFSLSMKEGQEKDIIQTQQEIHIQTTLQSDSNFPTKNNCEMIEFTSEESFDDTFTIPVHNQNNYKDQKPNNQNHHGKTIDKQDTAAETLKDSNLSQDLEQPSQTQNESKKKVQDESRLTHNLEQLPNQIQVEKQESQEETLPQNVLTSMKANKQVVDQLAVSKNIHRRFLSAQMNRDPKNESCDKKLNFDLNCQTGTKTPTKTNPSDLIVQLPNQIDKFDQLQSEDFQECSSRLDKSVINCLVCFENPPNSVYMDCGHGGLCNECALEIWKKTGECYLCRVNIRQVLQINLAKKPDGLIKVIASTQMLEVKNP